MHRERPKGLETHGARGARAEVLRSRCLPAAASPSGPGACKAAAHPRDRRLPGHFTHLAHVSGRRAERDAPSRSFPVKAEKAFMRRAETAPPARRLLRGPPPPRAWPSPRGGHRRPRGAAGGAPAPLSAPPAGPGRAGRGRLNPRLRPPPGPRPTAGLREGSGGAAAARGASRSRPAGRPGSSAPARGAGTAAAASARRGSGSGWRSAAPPSTRHSREPRTRRARSRRDALRRRKGPVATGGPAAPPCLRVAETVPGPGSGCS